MMESLKRSLEQNGFLSRNDLRVHIGDKTAFRLTDTHLKLIEKHVRQSSNNDSVKSLLKKRDRFGFKVFDESIDLFRSSSHMLDYKPWLGLRVKALCSQLDSIFGYTGFLSGFQGFIINEYVDSRYVGNQTEAVGEAFSFPNQTFFDSFVGTATIPNGELSPIFQAGLFFMVLSFCGNMIGCLLTFVVGLKLRGGFFHRRYIDYTYISMYVSIFGTTTFTISIMLMLYTISIHSYMLYTIYALIVSAYVFINTLLFLETRINTCIWDTNDGRKNAYALMDFMMS